MLAARSTQWHVTQWDQMRSNSEKTWTNHLKKHVQICSNHVQTMFQCVHWAWPARLLEKWYLWSETAWKAETDPNVRVASWICNCSHVDLPQQRGFKHHISVFKFKEAPISRYFNNVSGFIILIIVIIVIKSKLELLCNLRTCSLPNLHNRRSLRIKSPTLPGCQYLQKHSRWQPHPGQGRSETWDIWNHTATHGPDFGGERTLIQNCLAFYALRKPSNIQRYSEFVSITFDIFWYSETAYFHWFSLIFIDVYCIWI